jgi:tetratricopeptide (TPR) repeat protein
LAEAANRLDQATKAAKRAEGDLAKADEAAGKPESGSEALPARQEAIANALEAKNPEAAKAANDAAMALAQGDNAEAAKAQEMVQAALETMAKAGDAEAKALAGEQQKLADANKAIAKGRQENAEAREAARQATGALPGFMKAEVKKAEQLLDRAEAAAAQGLTQEAAKLEKDAVAQLEKAAAQLEAVAKEAGPESADATLAKDTPMSDQPGEPTPDQPMDSKQPPKGPNDPKPMPTPPGQELPKSTLKPNADEVGRFLRLPPREREALIQAWSEGLPPAHAAMIQRYYRELARTTPGRATP